MQTYLEEISTDFQIWRVKNYLDIGKNKGRKFFLDDNFFGCSKWSPLLEEAISNGKPFKFKQGMDERILTNEKCEMLFSAKYDGDYTFAFDIFPLLSSIVFFAAAIRYSRKTVTDSLVCLLPGI